MLAELLREDVALEMPPLLTWFTGRATVVRFVASYLLAGPGRIRLVPVISNGQLGGGGRMRSAGYRAPRNSIRSHAGLSSRRARVCLIILACAL